MSHKYHLYDLNSMGAHIPEYIELQADNLQDAIKEVIEINRVNREVGEPLLEHDKDFRLVKLRPFNVTDTSENESICWGENADQAGRQALLDIFGTSVDDAPIE